MKAAGPLRGLTVVVTGSRRGSELAALISNMGGEPYVVPTVGIILPVPDSEMEPFIRGLATASVDYALFMTATGVQTMVFAAERLGLKDQLIRSLNSPAVTVVARSGKPRSALAKHGIKVDASPPREEATAEGITKLIAPKVRGKRVTVLWHGSRHDELREELLAAGATEVGECLAYHYSRALDEKGAHVLGSLGFNYRAPKDEDVVRLIRELVERTKRVDAVTFTSPPAVDNLFQVAEEHGLDEELRDSLNTHVAVVAVGPTTGAAVESHGVTVHVMPQVSAMGAMLNALGEYLTAKDKNPHR